MLFSQGLNSVRPKVLRIIQHYIFFILGIFSETHDAFPPPGEGV